MSHAIEILNNLIQRITKVERYLNLEETNNRQNNNELDNQDQMEQDNDTAKTSYSDTNNNNNDNDKNNKNYNNNQNDNTQMMNMLTRMAGQVTTLTQGIEQISTRQNNIDRKLGSSSASQ
jgi:hypothetical protein